MVRRLDGEVEYLDELERVARILDARKAAEMRRFQRRVEVLERNLGEKSRIKRVKNRVKLFLKEMYEIER